MNKAELVEKVANQTALTKKTSREAIDAVISAITDSLAREKGVYLVGLTTPRVMEKINLANRHIAKISKP